MDRGLYVAMTGAKQIMQAQAVNNHNIANSSTTGYRADGVAFTSEPIYGPGYATRVNAVAGDAGTDFSSGVMMNTSRPLDIAVNGKGFIAVRGADGTVSVVPLGLSPAAQSQVDRIKLVNPPTKDLQKGADGLLRLKSGGKAKTDETVTVTSGELESSNVNAAQSLVNMIELQRLYELT